MDKLSIQEQRVIEACKKASSKHPLTRTGLKDITKCTDRDNRTIIGNLRSKGYRIIGGDKGYWYARSEKQYREWAIKYSAYAKTIMARVRAMDNHVEGQVSIDG